MSSPCSLHESITLADGRILSFADIGHGSDFPVIYFHGFPGSRLEAAFSKDIVAQNGVRVIAVERPGYGSSTFDALRTLSDWPTDVLALADALGLEKFSVLGVSSGGVYALACAAHISERLHQVGIACTPAPPEGVLSLSEMTTVAKFGFNLAHKHSWLSKLILGRLFRFILLRQAPGFLKVLGSQASQADRMALQQPAFYNAVLASLREAYRGGHRGPLYDLHLVSRDWDFKLEHIQRPIHLWHGSSDTVVPIAMGKHIASRLQQCNQYWKTDEGHFSITVNYMEEALQVLKG